MIYIYKLAIQRDTGFEQFISALKQYTRYSKKNINQLFHYADIFGLEVEMQKYNGGAAMKFKNAMSFKAKINEIA